MNIGSIETSINQQSKFIMFGFSTKKKLDAKHTQFTEELAEVASAFQFGLAFLDKEPAEVVMTQVLNAYFNQDPDPRLADYAACDHYLTNLAGGLIKGVNEGDFSLEDCTSTFFQTDNFLRGHGIYQTENSMEIMSMWQTILKDKGAFDNFD